MNKKLFGLFFFVVLAIVFFLAYPFAKEENANLPPPIFVEITEEKTITKPKKILDLAKDRPSKKFKIEDKSNPCRKIIDLFSNLSFKEVGENSEQIMEYASIPSCQNNLNFKGSSIETMKNKCLSSIEVLKSKECLNFLTLFRAWAINSNYSDENLAGLDETVLINKFLWNFTNNPDFKLDKLDIGLTMIDELISRRPDFYPAYKAKLIPLFFKATKYNQNMEEELASTLDSLNSLGGDEQVHEFPIVLNLNKKIIDGEKTKAHIDNFLREHPESSRGHYYLAALEWKKNKDLKAAESQLLKALKLNPNDKFVKDTLKSLKTSKDGKPIFYFSIDFNMGNL